MDKRKNELEKNPVIAAVLSTFPGVGHFYIGNIIKGISYILIFTALIVLQVHAHGNEHIVYALLLGGFYIFQIFDAFNDAKKTFTDVTQKEQIEKKSSLFSAFVILVLGIIFQLAELDIITYRKVAKLWPIILVAIGIKIIFEYFTQKEEDDE